MHHAYVAKSLAFGIGARRGADATKSPEKGGRKGGRGLCVRGRDPQRPRNSKNQHKNANPETAGAKNWLEFYRAIRKRCDYVKGQQHSTRNPAKTAQGEKRQNLVVGRGFNSLPGFDLRLKGIPHPGACTKLANGGEKTPMVREQTLFVQKVSSDLATHWRSTVGPFRGESPWKCPAQE